MLLGKQTAGDHMIASCLFSDLWYRSVYVEADNKRVAEQVITYFGLLALESS